MLELEELHQGKERRPWRAGQVIHREWMTATATPNNLGCARLQARPVLLVFAMLERYALLMLRDKRVIWVTGSSNEAALKQIPQAEQQFCFTDKRVSGSPQCPRCPRCLPRMGPENHPTVKDPATTKDLNKERVDDRGMRF